MSPSPRALVTASSCLVLACGQHSQGLNPFGPGTGGITDSSPSSDPVSATESAGTSGGMTESGSVNSGTGEFKFDIGNGEGGGPAMGCEKIDFLFVVDNSGSMGAHQSALVNSFGPFIDTIYESVEAKDFHIMVVDSDGGEDITTTCEPCNPDSFWCGDWCSTKASLDVTCEKTLGAGEVAPHNHQASNEICGVPGGKRYLTSDLDQAEIEERFACMARVGVFGWSAELPMSAMVEAVTTQSAQGGCNAGFLRDDAVLVVTLISDDYPVPEATDNASTVGSPQAWYDAVVDAKGGKQTHVVMLGIINTEDATCVSGAGDPIVHPTERFVELVELFGDQGFTGNICGSDYDVFFEQAVSIIDTACDEFVPEG